jgi:hypothetical protein
MTPLFEVPGSPEQLPAVTDEVVQHGEVFTRRWMVDSILDWVGYTAERDLPSLRLVDPACGQGAFVVAAAERLSRACLGSNRRISEAAAAIRAYDLLNQHVVTSRRAVASVLAADGWPTDDISTVVAEWIRCGDFLLEGPTQAPADFVVGNPPYVRLEDVPAARAARYRQVCPTMVGRADLYVGFYDIGLRSLKPGGRLGFICADRWMRNQYGRQLRAFIESRYSVEACISMHDVDAFEEQVSAYPAVTVIARKPQGPAVLAEAQAGYGPADAAELRTWAQSQSSRPIRTHRYRAARLPAWFRGESSWPSGSPARLGVIEQLNERFRPLQDELTGTRVGIGVATGADAVFITSDPEVVERERLLPLMLVRDTCDGRPAWSGHFLVNPWTDNGALVDLRAYPRLRAYLGAHESALRSRHVGRRQPERWYRTIDKVDAGLISRPKLLFPDLKVVPDPVLDPGGHYPHHNLYYVVSDCWDLEVLGGLLMSAVAGAFVEAYGVRMRGGTLRFQAQYLRRIRVPDPSGISEPEMVILREAFRARDREAATAAALRVYGLPVLPE